MVHVTGQNPGANSNPGVTSRAPSASNATLNAKAKSKYDEILEKHASYPDRGFSKDAVQNETKSIREYEQQNPEIKSLDERRIEFVLKLFKK